MLFAAISVGALAFAGSGCGDSGAKKGDGRIEVLSLWGGSEKAAFLKVTDAFTKRTGIAVRYTTARDFEPVIRTRLAAGNPPDVAIIPRPGVLADLARQGALKRLDDLGLDDSYLRERYGEAWIDLGTVDGALYGVAAKANSKSLIWYRPQVLAREGLSVPDTWEGLLDLTRRLKQAEITPWAQGAKDSWTLTDWFENLYVRTAGPQKYDQLFAGKLPFTDRSVANAIALMLKVLNGKYVAGGIDGALGIGFVDGIGQVFGRAPRAALYMEGGFVGGIATQQVNRSLEPGETIDSFPWPTVDPRFGEPLVGGGDLAAVFQDDREVEEFLKYISSAEAGRIWVSTGAIVSPNKLVPKTAYPNELVRAEARQVAGAELVRFDGSDLLPGSLADDWGATLQHVIQNPNRTRTYLEQFQQRAERVF